MTYKQTYKVIEATLQELAERGVIDLSNVNPEEIAKSIFRNLEHKDIVSLFCTSNNETISCRRC